MSPLHFRAGFPRALTLVPLALASLSAGICAQVEEVWSASVPSNPFASLLALDADGRVASGGSQFGSSNLDAVLVVLEADGTLAWTETIDFGEDDGVNDFVFDPDGDLLALADSVGFMGPGTSYLVRFDPNGVVLWTESIPFSSSPRRVGVAPNGDVIVVGEAVVAGSTDIELRRYDPAGVLLQTATADGPEHEIDFARAFAILADGAVVVAGQGNFGSSGSFSGSDSLVVRFGADGSTSWVRALAGPGMTGFEGAMDVVVDAAGNAYACGYRRLSDTATEGYVWKLDPLGNTMWLEVQGSPVWGSIAIAIDPRGDLLAVSDGSGAAGSFLRKLDATGAILWDRTRPESIPSGLILDAGGEPFIFGGDSSTGGMRPFVTRYDRNGLERWTRTRPKIDGVGESFGGAAVFGSDELYLRGSLLVHWEPTVTQYCFGDGSGSACPCGNSSAIADREGCLSSLGVGGRLIDAGVASLGADTLQLHASGVTDTFVTFFQGMTPVAGGSGLPFGDGLRCVGGSQVRIATRPASSNTCVYPSSSTDQAISVKGLVDLPGTRYYQVIFRNSAPFCTSATFNQTNALQVTWVP